MCMPNFAKHAGLHTGHAGLHAGDAGSTGVATGRPARGCAEVNCQRSDFVGIACSLGCAVHCLAVPGLIAIVPNITAASWLDDPRIHQVAAVVSAIVVAWAIIPNWNLYRDKTVVATAAMGLALLAIAAFAIPDACCDVPNTEATTVPMSLPSPADVGPQSTADGSTKDESAVSAVIGMECFQAACTSGNKLLLALLPLKVFLTPIGGCMLLLAHIFNMQLTYRPPMKKS